MYKKIIEENVLRSKIECIISIDGSRWYNRTTVLATLWVGKIIQILEIWYLNIVFECFINSDLELKNVSPLLPSGRTEYFGVRGHGFE